MSVSLTDVLNSAGYDPVNDIDDAKWFFAQFNEYDELASKAQELLDDYEDYQEWCEREEELGNQIISFEDWRNKCLLR